MEHNRVRWHIFPSHTAGVDFAFMHSFRTVLSSAGNDGRIRLWKATVGNVWRAAGNISVEQAEEQEEADVEMDDHTGAE